MQLPCPACGHATEQRLLYAKNGCDILQCTACGLGRAEARGFDPQSYYTGEYFSGGHDDGYADYVGAEPVLRREFAQTVGFIRKHKPGGTLLDLGCAYGFFLQEAKAHFTVAGIEIAEDAAAYARDHGLTVFSGIADDDNLAKVANRIGTLDVIVLLDVIEHLPDPRATLALCARHLNPGGIIVITTGDFASPYARFSGHRWRLMTPPQHLWYFTRDSVRRLAQPLGLSMTAFDHPWKIVPTSLIAFQFRRMLGLRTAANETAPTASRIGLPVNLFDAMRVVLRKSEAAAPSVDEHPQINAKA